jgi:hypothetical protein
MAPVQSLPMYVLYSSVQYKEKSQKMQEIRKKIKPFGRF